MKLPVRCYSQGMMLRLAFGISTGIRQKLFLLDEIIGVGDQTFAAKAKSRIAKLIDAASILILASHNHEIVRSFCTSAIWLAQGRMVASGPVDDILNRYSANLPSHTVGGELTAE